MRVDSKVQSTQNYGLTAKGQNIPQESFETPFRCNSPASCDSFQTWNRNWPSGQGIAHGDPATWVRLPERIKKFQSNIFHLLSICLAFRPLWLSAQKSICYSQANWTKLNCVRGQHKQWMRHLAHCHAAPPIWSDLTCDLISRRQTDPVSHTCYFAAAVRSHLSSLPCK